MNRRRLLFAGLALAPIAVVAACTFPTVSFSPDNEVDGGRILLPDGAPAPDGTIVLPDGNIIEPEAGPDAMGPSGIDDAGSDANDAGSDANAIADAAPDAATQPDSSLADGGCCDCDGDGWATSDELKNADCHPTNGVSAYDCDDMDPRAHPNELNYLDDQPVSPTFGNWNCVNGVEKQYDAGVNCAAHATSVLGLSFDCTTVAGFTASEVDCGASSPYVTCQNPGGLATACTANNPVNVVQGCK